MWLQVSPTKPPTTMRQTVTIAISAAVLLGAAPRTAAQPAYSIVDLGALPGHNQSFGTRISANGIATGFSFSSTSSMAFRWTQTGGLVGLPNLTSPARPFSRGAGVNNNGVVVGTGGVDLSLANPLPLTWHGSSVTQLPLPTSSTLAAALDVNLAEVAVGYAVVGAGQFGVRYSGGSASVITQTTSNGSFLMTAYGINDAGRIVGQGIDPNNAAVNVGYVLDPGAGIAFTVGALPGMNGAICYDVNEAGHIVGVSMLDQGDGLPFIWTDATGIRAIPLPAGSISGSGRGVNASGAVVGNTSTTSSSVPFLWNGVNVYRLGDLIPAGTGWDLLNNTTSEALGISDDGVIVGTGLHNGQIRAFAMIPVPEPGSMVFVLVSGLSGAIWRRMQTKRARPILAGPSESRGDVTTPS